MCTVKNQENAQKPRTARDYYVLNHWVTVLKMNSKAVVAHASNQLQDKAEILFSGPGGGEALVNIMATGVCHTNARLPENEK